MIIEIREPDGIVSVLGRLTGMAVEVTTPGEPPASGEVVSASTPGTLTLLALSDWRPFGVKITDETVITYL